MKRFAPVAYEDDGGNSTSRVMKLSPFLFRYVPLLVLLAGLTGCGESGEQDEALRALEEELAGLEQRVAVERSKLQEARVRHEEAEQEAQMVRLSFACEDAAMRWRGGSVVVAGEFVNDSEFSASSASLHVALVDGINVRKEERLEIAFDPLLLPGTRVPFSVEASPFIWGFQEAKQGGTYRFTIEKVVLGGGKTVTDDFAATRARQAEIERMEAQLTKVRLEHGAVYSRIKGLAN